MILYTIKTIDKYFKVVYYESEIYEKEYFIKKNNKYTDIKKDYFIFI